MKETLLKIKHVARGNLFIKMVACIRESGWITNSMDKALRYG